MWGGDRLRPLAPHAAPVGPVGEAWFGDADEQPAGVLVKLLDVQDRLSVQVHPDDDLAKVIHGATAIGKHEAWIVLEAAPGAELLLGRGPSVTSAEVTSALTAGSDITPLLARHAVHRGDVFDVPTGCLHALMPGLLIWEVQQRSDRTYRVADWGRNDPSRPLHTKEAILATDAGHQATRITAINWSQAGEQNLVAAAHFAARAVVGPWTGSITIGAQGATATATGPLTVGGIRLEALATVHTPAGETALEITEGAALLIAEGRR